jgi:Holliday junction resolvase RusA-like endonuclease
MSIDVFIKGVPYCQSKVKGDLGAGKRWTQVVIQATQNLPKVKRPCSASIAFILPEDKYPADCPYGPDLDNLLKRLFDALTNTIFSEIDSKDGSVIELIASKREASRGEPIGARVTVNEL